MWEGMLTGGVRIRGALNEVPQEVTSRSYPASYFLHRCDQPVDFRDRVERPVLHEPVWKEPSDCGCTRTVNLAAPRCRRIGPRRPRSDAALPRNGS